MKYPVYALLALLALSMIACKNTPNTPTDTATTAGSADQSTTLVDDGPPPAADPVKFNEQMLADMIAARGSLRKKESDYKAMVALTLEMKQSYKIMPEQGREQIAKIYGELQKFTAPFDKQKALADQLDSLTTQMGDKRISIQDAQKEYVAIRPKLRASEKELAAAQVDFPALKSEFERIFSDANKKAAGGQ